MSVIVLPDGRPRLQRIATAPPTPPPDQPSLFDRVPGGIETARPGPQACPGTAESRFAGALLRGMVEVLQGRRAPGQLVRWLDDLALARLAELRRRLGDEQARTVRLLSMHVQVVSEGRAEVCARLGDERHSWALALRIAGPSGRAPDRWCCSTVEIGPQPVTSCRGTA